jgi:amino acid transporter
MIQLKENSITARMYRWFYTKQNMPNNLCPYFWKVVIMYLVIIPYFLGCLPVVVSKRLQKIQKTVETIRPLISLVVYMLFILLFFALCPLINLFYKMPEKFVTSGYALYVILGVILVVIGIILFFEWLKDRRNKIEYQRELLERMKQNNLDPKNFDFEPIRTPAIFVIVEYIKAYYKKYCPQITWNKSSN